MKIYEFDYGGATDWVFAPNIKEARKFYIQFSECGDLDGCTVKSVPKSKWSEMTIINPDEFNEEGEYQVIETFKEYAERNTQTDIIATTEF